MMMMMVMTQAAEWSVQVHSESSGVRGRVSAVTVVIIPDPTNAAYNPHASARRRSLSAAQVFNRWSVVSTGDLSLSQHSAEGLDLHCVIFWLVIYETWPKKEKRCEIWRRLQLISNRKSPIGFPLRPRSMTLDDLERLYRPRGRDFNVKVAISRKRCEIGPRLQLITNRNN